MSAPVGTAGWSPLLRANPLALVAAGVAAVPASLAVRSLPIALVTLAVYGLVLLALVPARRYALLCLAFAAFAGLTVAYSTWRLGGRDEVLALTAGLRIVVLVVPCVLLVGLRGEQRRAVGHRLEYGYRRDAALDRVRVDELAHRRRRLRLELRAHRRRRRREFIVIEPRLRHRARAARRRDATRRRVRERARATTVGRAARAKRAESRSLNATTVQG